MNRPALPNHRAPVPEPSRARSEPDTTPTTPAPSASVGRGVLVAQWAAIAIVYFAAAKAGLALAIVNANATAVWPPTGIAMFAVLWLGPAVWPGVLLGAFAANVTTSGMVAPSAGIAVGNTLEALLAGWLTRRYARGPAILERPADVFRFAAFGGLLSPLVSAGIGVSCLMASGLAAAADAPAVALTWWLGDGAGALIVTPLLLSWAARPRLDWPRARWFELAGLAATLAASAAVVFGGVLGTPRGVPITYLCFPALTWAAFRFGVREASAAMALLTLAATLGTLQGYGPFARSNPNESLLLLQGFAAIMSVLLLAVAASATERDDVSSSMRRLNEQLERRVQDRTQQLATANDGLRSEIRERARIEAQLRTSELRLREAQRVAQVGSWEWDILRDEVWWSEELYRIYGLDPAEFRVSYDAFLARVHPEDRDMVRQSVSDSLRTGQSYAVTYRVLRDDASILIVQAQGHVLSDEGGQPVRMVGIAQDVTERKRAEAARAELAHEQVARREAEEAHRLKDLFLGALSHEIRTPLQTIGGWTQLLLEGGLDAEERRAALETIARNVQLQTRLLSDVLDISRLVAGNVVLERKAVRLAEVLERALESAAPPARARQVRLLTVIDPQAPVIRGDARRLQQVFTHLLSNAVKFAREGGVVVVAVEPADGSVRVRVEDDGPGIPEEYIPHLFERFRRPDAMQSRRQGGLGVGLAIVRALVELHGGTVSAANRTEAPGAAFTVLLPASADAKVEAEARVPEPELGRRALDGVRVLVVEDDRDSRDVVVLEISRAGAHVRGAGSAAEALEALDRDAYDVMVSDIAMPGQDGYELMGQLRRRPAERNGTIPAVALTAYTDDASVTNLLAVGYQAHLAKPVSPEALVRLLSRLSRSRLEAR